MFRRKPVGYQYLERQIAMRIAEAQRNERRHAGRLPHPALKAAVVGALVALCLALFLPMCLAGCAANRVAFSESHWYPDGAPKSTVTLNQMQLVTAGSKLQEGANTFVRLDDQSIESGNASSGLDAGGDPVELLQAAVPLLALLEPTTAVSTVAKPDSMSRLIEILRALRGAK